MALAVRNRRLGDVGRCFNRNRRSQPWQRMHLSVARRSQYQARRSIGKADPSERLEVTVLVRRRAGDALQERVGKLARRRRSAGHIGA